MIFKISKLKIIEIRQRNAFSIKNGMFLIYYIANLNFPGIPGKFPEYFGNSRSREIEIVREIPNPSSNLCKNEFCYVWYSVIKNFLTTIIFLHFQDAQLLVMVLGGYRLAL